MCHHWIEAPTREAVAESADASERDEATDTTEPRDAPTPADD